jgi:hypothetical protein
MAHICPSPWRQIALGNHLAIASTTAPFQMPRLRSDFNLEIT